MDILTALAGARTTKGTGRCKLQTAIDSIPEDTPGRDDLITAVNGALSQRKVSVVLARIGIPVGPTTVGEHRANECACYR